MKRLNTTLLIIILMIGLVGCGIQIREVPPPVSKAELLNRAWAAYDSLNFDVAIARFDSVLNLDATESQAYLGKGMALGLKNKFPQAHNFLNLTVFAEGQSAILFTPSDTLAYNPINIDPLLGYYPAIIPQDKQPLLYPDNVVYEIYYTFQLLVTDTINDSTFEYIDTGSVKEDAVIRHFSDTTVYIDTLVFPSPEEEADLPSNSDIDSVLSVDYEPWLYLRYYYLSSDNAYLTDYPVLAYGANGAVYLAEQDYPSAIRSSRASVILSNSFQFEHYPYFSMRNILLIEAYSAFRDGFPRRCVEVLTEMDPTWEPPENPDHVSSFPYILEELEKLIKEEGGTIF